MAHEFDRRLISQITNISNIILVNNSFNDLTPEDNIVFQSAKELYIFMLSNDNDDKLYANIILSRLISISFNQNCNNYTEYLNIALPKLSDLISDLSLEILTELEENNLQDAEYFEEIIKKESEVILPPIYKNIVVKKENQNKKMVDSCSICFEKHNLLECVVTPCDHLFGFTCMNNWIETNITQKQKTLCPLCKNPICKLIKFTNE